METRFQEREARIYYERGFWRANDLWADFVARVAEVPDKTAVVCGQYSATFDELRRAASSVAVRLERSGILPGDVVGLYGRHSVEALVALLGCINLGAVVAPVPPIFGDQQVDLLLSQCSAKALITFGERGQKGQFGLGDMQVPVVIELGVGGFAELVAEGGGRQHQPVDADAPAVILLSSGTTSVPKGVVHSTNTLRYASEQVLARWGLRGDDCMLVVVEFGFVGALVFGYLPALLSGATAVLLPRWEVNEACRLVEAHRCSYVLLMPTHGADFLYYEDRDTFDLSSLRVLVAAGMSHERRVALYEATGLPPLGDYGLSEVPGNCAPAPEAPLEKILTTEGLPFDGTEIRICEGDARVEPGVDGEVVVNGPSRFLGFLGNDTLTRDSIAEWGGYRTGDVGRIDPDGYFTYVGREKDIIRRGGVTIVPSEVEIVLIRHPAVREVAIVGFDDGRLGERGCAAIILQPRAEAPSLQEVQAFLAEAGVAKYAWPEAVEIFNEFPRTPSLKAVKRDIRAEVARRRNSSGTQAQEREAQPK